MVQGTTRLLTICTLLTVLVGLFVWAGTMHPDPANNDFPTDEELVDGPERYVGDRITVSGRVVETNPLTIEAYPRPDTPIRFAITGATTNPAVGDSLRVHGDLIEPNRIEAHTTVHREPWEATYMYVVSFLAGLLVLGRLVDHWTVDTDAWAVVPRQSPLHKRTGDTDA